MKKSTSNILTQFYFYLILVLLIIPGVQMVFRPFDEKPLYGAIEQVESPELTPSGWFGETFQQNAESFLNQHFGFRNMLVRIYNQLKFCLYDQTSANSVVIGKDNYLYEENYIKAYYGRDFIGDSTISKRVERLKKLQDTLRDINKTFIVALAPGKAQFYPDYIPDYLRGEKRITNYEAFLNEAEKQGLEIIDFNRWFLDMKDTSAFPLYPKTGIHWSHYGMNLSLDSLLSYIENHQAADVPDLHFSEVQLSDSLHEPDQDIEQGMNLLLPIEKFPLAYNHFTVRDQNKEKLKVMVISDSFFWALYNKGVMSELFDDGEFWYYNRQIFQPSADAPYQPIQVDLRDEILEKDVIVLLTTDANLPDFPWEFDEKAYKALFENDSLIQARRLAKIRGYMHAIKNSPDWLEDVAAKARERNIPLDSMIRLDAMYMYEMEMKN